MEDDRFLRGKGRYVDDSAPDNVAYLGIVRSPYAHARIESIDLTKVSSSPEFVGSLTGSDLVGKINPLFETPGQRKTSRYQLANGMVRFVGEAVVALAVRHKYAVEDLLEQVEVNYSPIQPVAGIEQAKRSHELVYDEWGDNIALRQTVRRGDPDTAFRTARHVVKRSIGIRRQAGIPMEPRSVIVSYDQVDERYSVYAGVQSVHKFRNYLSTELGVELEKIHYTVNDVGGGFGVKGAQSYPEVAISAVLAKKTGHKIKWVSTRTEDLLESSPDRDQYCEIELACDVNAKIVGLRAKIEADIGVMGTFNISLPHTIMLLPGAYKIPNISIEGSCYVTNKCPVGPVRGAGRPEACFFIESAVDAMARELGMDPIEFRRRNVIQPEEFPYDNGAGCTYDSGNYPLVLDTLSKAISGSQTKLIQSEKVDSQGRVLASGKLIGRSVSFVIEDTGAQMLEVAKIIASRDGQITLVTGSSAQGQGHETTLSQLCSKELGVALEKIQVRSGDTELISKGYGTFGSRSLSVGGSAALQACRELESLLLEKASEKSGKKREQLTFLNGQIVDLSSNSALFDLDAILKELDTESISVTTNFALKSLPFASGAQFVELSIDCETGMVEIGNVIVVDDCGRVINPSIVDGQIHGGVAHGLGGSLYEQITFDGDCQPLATNLMEYLIPTAQTMPDVRVLHVETPSPVTLSGAKGVGESGTIGAYSSIFNALNDGLKKVGASINYAPATPEDLLNALRSRKSN